MNILKVGERIEANLMIDGEVGRGRVKGGERGREEERERD